MSGAAQLVDFLPSAASLHIPHGQLLLSNVRALTHDDVLAGFRSQSHTVVIGTLDGLIIDVCGPFAREYSRGEQLCDATHAPVSAVDWSWLHRLRGDADSVASR